MLKTINANLTACAVVWLSTAWHSTAVNATEPELQTPAPVIFLKDNLGESSNLGWCIDTVGRGLSDRLHAHSCKPRGGDVQFRYDQNDKKIVSVAFAELCAEVDSAADDGYRFLLSTCQPENTAQEFIYNADDLMFRISQNTDLCVAVDQTISSAGPFLSRQLVVEKCDEVALERARWVIKE